MIIPRYYQIEAMDAIYNYFMSNSGNPLIALPTGTGKSLIPALFISSILKKWPNQRFLMITSVKELIHQNSEVLKEVWNEAPLGIFSAGLKQKNSAMPIVYGGIQSMIKDPMRFGSRDLIFIDECHLVNQDETSQYQSFLACMKLINPHVKIVGMTATKFRMGQGLLTDKGLFTDIVYDLTDLDGFNKLLSEGFMAPLIPLRTQIELDISNVSVQKGEFVSTQLQGAVDKAPITFKALQEFTHAGQNRKSWLIFASGIEHAEHIAEQLGAFGVECAPVHSKRPTEYNDAAIKAFKASTLRAIVNYGKLTTGFNHPEIDHIGMLRPTLSVPLWVQMLGRGTRPAKENCLVMDFARNTTRLGPINDPRIPNKKQNKDGDIPVKLCDSCGAYNHISARLCCNCGEEFTFKIKIVAKAGTEELIKTNQTEDTAIVETFNVLNAIYAKHNGKLDKPPSLKVTYFTTGLAFKEYVCLEHSGMAGKIARDWWRSRHKTEPPKTIDDALNYISELRCPRFIRVHCNKKYPEILGTEF